MPKYCFDTSALVDGWIRSYPYDIFPSLWTNLDQMIEAGDIICPDEVFVELKKKEDGLYQWAAKRKMKLFYHLDSDLQLAVIDIEKQFPGLAAQKSFRNHADPFVIGLAKIIKGIVVTGERNKGGFNEFHVKIPFACKHYGIRCISLLEFIREQKWNF